MEYKKVVRGISNAKGAPLIQQINLIKQNVNAGEYKDALKLLPLFNKYLHKSPIFKQIEDVHQKQGFQFTNDFKKEYKWITNILEDHLVLINSFIDSKLRFEVLLHTGEFDKAKVLLFEIEENYGISLWSIEANLMIEEYQNGSEANWNKLSYYLKEIKNSIYEFIISAISKKVEAKLSYDNFLSQFQNDLDNAKANGAIKDFFVFKTFPSVLYEYKSESLEGVLYVANILSVIDQYLILVDVITYNISHTTDLDKLFLPFVKKAKDIVTSDFKLVNIYNVINDKNDFISLPNTEPIIKIANCYYSGDFQQSLELSKKFLKLFPMEFDLHEIYSKSLINMGKAFEPLFIGGICDAILENTYNLLTFKREDGFSKLLKNSLFLINCNMGKQIYGLLYEAEGYTGPNYTVSLLSASFSSYKTPVLFKIRKSLITKFNSLSNEPSFQTYILKYGESPVPANIALSSSAQQNDILRGINCFYREKYEDVLLALTDSHCLDENTYYLERKIGLLFYSYLHLNKLKECVAIFGDVFFKKMLVTKKPSFGALYRKIVEIKERSSILSCIEYPILFSLHTKEYDLYEAFDDFIETIGVSNILELDLKDFVDRFSHDKAVYFLKNVCTIDTIKYSTDYGSISEVEEDRLKILDMLIQIDSINKLSYEKEKEEIYRMNSVRKVLKEVDEGRLYIDINNLKTNQVKKFSDTFLRYKEIEQSATIQSLIGFNPSTIKNWENALLEKSEKADIFNNADYLAFKNIYLESRDNFLFSKEYGLDSCLSTRIRHGALKNHIRSVFEKLDLMTSKIDSRYKDNVIWGKQLQHNPEVNYQVQTLLKSFSKQIDDYSIFIVENLIQIQTEKTTGKDDGLFTFFTSDELLFKFYSQNKQVLDSVDTTIDIILTSLTTRTLIEIQENIYNYFSDVILVKFREIIDGLISELRSLNLPQECQLISKVLISNTDIQNELESISTWFFLHTTNPSTLLEIETVVEASVELMNKINPTFRLDPVIQIKCENFGVYSSLIFVFNILFNNIIQHSELRPNELKVNVEFETLEKYIVLKVKNNINPNKDYTSNLEKLRIIKENWNDHSKIEKSNKEGESGYDKIKRILLYETHSKTDRFDYLFENNTISIHIYFPYVKLKENDKSSDN